MLPERPETIRSAQNPRFRWLAEQITQPRARRREASIWLEGERLVEAMLLLLNTPSTEPGPTWTPICLVLQADLADTLSAQPRWRQLFGLCLEAPIILDASRFQQVSQMETPPGIGLLARRADPSPHGITPAGDLLLLDRLQDPGNIGTVLRTGAAAGLKRAWLLAGTAEAYSPKALRAGMGAQLGMWVEEGIRSEDLADRLAAEQLRPVLTLAPGAGVSSLYAEELAGEVLSLPTGLVWCLGQEGSGLSEALLSLPNAIRLSIPQATGPCVESLNVSAAAAVCLFERRRLLSIDR